MPCSPTKHTVCVCTDGPSRTDTDSPSGAMIKSPAKELARRSSMLTSQIPMPPSPAAVTDAIDQQTRRIRTSISHAYERTQIHQYADSTRDLLSSPLTVSVLAILLEAYGLRGKILPNKILTEVPALPYLTTQPIPVKVPDLFLLLEQKFWAPFSLWFLASLVVPAIISYFINLPLKAHPSHTYSTRRATLEANSQLQFDPFVFSLAKGLLAYLIYAQHFDVGGLYTHHTITTVNESILGGYFSILISSGLGAAVGLYEAVLKK